MSENPRTPPPPPPPPLGTTLLLILLLLQAAITTHLPMTNHQPLPKKSPTHKHNHTKVYNPTIPPATTAPNTTATKTLSQIITAEKSPCCLCAPLPCCCPLLPPSVAEALDPLSFVLVAAPVRIVVFVSGIIVVAAVVVKRVSLAVKIPVKISLLGRLEKLVRAAYVEHRELLRRVGWGMSLSLWFSCSCSWFSRGAQTTIWSGLGLGVSMGMGGRVVCAYSCCCCSCCCWARTLAVRRCSPRDVARSCGIMGVIFFFFLDIVVVVREMLFLFAGSGWWC